MCIDHMMKRALGNISREVKVKKSIFVKMHLLLNRGMQKYQTLLVHRSHDVEGTGQDFVNYVFSCKCIFSLTMEFSNIKLC